MLYETQQNLLNASMVLKPKDFTEDAAAPDLDKDRQGQVTFDDLLLAVGTTKNRDAFIRLFEYFAPRIKSFLMKGGIAQEMADELAQETMLAVWEKAGSYNPAKASASTWIFTVARNKKIDYFRKSGRATEEDADDLALSDESDLQDEELNKSEQGKLLAGAIDQLPAEQAKLIRKSFFEEKTHADIAKETGLPLGTVKSRIRLALERLRYALGDTVEVPE